jgi:hypothetical protein
MTAYVLAVLAAEDTDAALFAAKGLVGGGPAAEYLVWRREPCPRTGCGRCSPMSCAALWRGDRRPVRQPDRRRPAPTQQCRAAVGRGVTRGITRRGAGHRVDDPSAVLHRGNVAPARRWPPCGLTGTRSSDIALAGEEPVVMSSGQLVGRVDDLPSGKVT